MQTQTLKHSHAFKQIDTRTHKHKHGHKHSHTYTQRDFCDRHGTQNYTFKCVHEHVMHEIYEVLCVCLHAYMRVSFV